MPLLKFTLSVDAPVEERRSFEETVANLYADRMQTSHDHIAVELTHVETEDMWIGRADPGEYLFLDAEIREGRTHEERREFALAVMDDAMSRWGLPKPNMKVVFTEHRGPLMMGYDRVGGAWSPDESNGSG